jgi:hypothetical protein
LATSNAVRADDGSGKNIATRTGTEDAVTKHWQRVLISDPTTPTQELAIDASGFAKVINQANSGVDIGDVTINNAAGASAINIQDGGNSITVDGTLTSVATITNVVHVDDNASSLTVDGTVAASNLPTTVDTNSGVKSASTLRVVLATDQPALTNKLLVTPDSVALPANQSVNVNQINSVTPLMGAGNTGTGSLRVTIATDQAQLTNALKVDGSAVTQPVSIASVPSHAVTNAGTFAVQVSSQPATPSVTLLSVAIAASSSGNNTLIAAGGASNKIYVVAFSLSFSGTVNAKFQSGASGTDLTGLYYGIANAGAGSAIAPPAFLFATAANTLLNLNISGAVAVGGHVTYYIAT